MKKKVLSLTLALFMVLAFLPASVMAEGEEFTPVAKGNLETHVVKGVEATTEDGKVVFTVKSNEDKSDWNQNSGDGSNQDYTYVGVYVDVPEGAKSLKFDDEGGTDVNKMDSVNSGSAFIQNGKFQHWIPVVTYENSDYHIFNGNRNYVLNLVWYDGDNCDGNEVARQTVTISREIEKPEAKIGDKTYYSLEDALYFAQSGETVTLLSDIVTSQAITLKDGVTLDGNNHKITAEGKINAIEALGKSVVKNLTVDTGKDGKYAVQAYMTDGAVIENVKVIDNSEGYAGLLVNGGTATLRNVSYEGSSYSVVELAKGENVVNNPVVTIDGSITSTNNVPAFYVDAKQISNPDVNSLIVVNDTASGLIVPGSSLEFDKNGVLIVTKPAVKPEAPVCAGSKDKNCDGVVTCDEEKGEGWTWNNKLKVCEYTGKTSYTVVNTAAK